MGSLVKNKMNKYINSDKIISRVQEKTGWTRTQIAAKIFDISKNNLGNRIREDRLDFYKLLNWAVNNNVNKEWLITGEDPTIGKDKELVPLDIEVLTKVITGVEDYLREGDIEIEPDKKGRLISVLYERFIKTGEEPDQKTIVSYLKLVA